MNKQIVLCILVFCSDLCWAKLFPIEYRIPLSGKIPEPGTPWPKPQLSISNHFRFSIDPSQFVLSSNIDSESCIVMREAMHRYREIILNDVNYRPAPFHLLITNVFVYVSDDSRCGYPPEDMREEYWIEIPHPEQNNQIWITARSIWGALRGLETLSQLIYSDEKSHLFVNSTRIYDFPRYQFRAILLDSARHFLPKKTLLANLDAMSMNKFNVFHWHLVDDQSFPIELKSYPNISRYGAYSSKHIYRSEDVQEIIEFARMRGIRVIPELDTPGHTHAMAQALPNLLTPCYGDGMNPYTPNYPFFSKSEILNPMLNQSFDFMRELYKEFRENFKDDYIHLGMDEVSYDCWKSNPEINRFIRSRNWKNLNQLEQYYVQRTILNIRDVGYKYLMYQDPVDNGVSLANDSIVVVWKDRSLDSGMDKWQNYIKNVAQKGYRIILSACWYLNYINYPYPGMDWEKYYLCDPKNFDGTEKEKNLVIGGEACLWGEFVDGTNLIARLWPRASAVAERLWSDPTQTQDVDSARHRLDQHRCRMVRRGIPASPILNGFCGDYDWDL
ncbi:calreticulin [Sarcoptes scabiei]|nr:calreticulin [Sarcoptes scabiei]